MYWLPGVVSQSVILRDTVDLEMAGGLEGHVQVNLSPEPLS
jgi:hypothetical protein